MTNLEIATVLFDDLYIRAIPWYDMRKITYEDIEIDEDSLKNKIKCMNPIANEHAVITYIMAMTEEF